MTDCVYCNGYSHLTEDPTDDDELTLENQKNGRFIIACPAGNWGVAPSDYSSKPIRYCPMCGRKL